MMASTQAWRATLAAAARAEALLPPEGDLHTQDTPGPSWVLLAMNFLGAQLVVLPFLGFLALLSYETFFKPPGVWIACAVLLAGASLVLRRPPGLFATQLAFSALIAGLALLVVALDFRQNNPSFLLLLAVLLGVAGVVRVAWVQRVLGCLAAGVAMALEFGAHVSQAWWRPFAAYPSPALLVALALAWALWCAREPRGSTHAGARNMAALADGVGVALLLAAALASTRHFWSLENLVNGGPRGSADEATAGLAHLLDFGWPAAVQLVLVVGAAAWLVRHWKGQAPGQPRSALFGRLGLVFAVLALACLGIPQVGVVALVATVALGTGRRALLALAGLVLLAQLSGFYYALQWPLVHKAALLAGTGAALALALWALRQRQPARAPATAPVKAPHGWLAPIAIAVAGLAAVAMVHRDVQHKEQVIAQGEKIYLPLAPRDPRSLMQGDYMALNFAIPTPILHELDEQKSAGWSHHAQVAVRLDPRGVAHVLRVAPAGEPLAANERHLQLKRQSSEWVLVTDAFYFPEGQGKPFGQARFGEFRALSDGRALLVGLADESLRPIAPAAPSQE